MYYHICKCGKVVTEVSGEVYASAPVGAPSTALSSRGCPRAWLAQLQHLDKMACILLMVVLDVPAVPMTPAAVGPLVIPESVRKNSADCTYCADVSTPYMDNNNLECATWPWMREHRCNKDPNWTLLKVCQFSCYQNGAGYPGDNCCDTVLGSKATAGCPATAEYTIPDTMVHIPENAFYECHNLRSVVIPSHVKSIGKYSFFNCSSLKSVTIEEGVPAIGFGAFCTCTALESITIPETVESIGENAFYDAKALTSVTIPKNVKSMGKCEERHANGTVL